MRVLPEASPRALQVSWMQHRLAFHVLTAGLVLIAGGGCRTDKSAGERTAIALRDFAVTLELPASWAVVAGQSDTTEGLVAFSGPCGSGYSGSGFLDASSQRAPASIEEAEREALKADGCREAGACNALAREPLPDGGYLVTTRSSRAVRVESWVHLGPNQVVRCGAEVFREGAAPESPKQAAGCRAWIEKMCRSVTLK
ncbi:MAG TPA: hypothetical protein VFQ61_05410 [Polyangiaceae bacterium]|nr:hypothetical protein [Polyangiaceae bacterium]